MISDKKNADFLYYESVSETTLISINYMTGKGPGAKLVLFSPPAKSLHRRLGLGTSTNVTVTESFYPATVYLRYTMNVTAIVGAFSNRRIPTFPVTATDRTSVTYRCDSFANVIIIKACKQ